MGSHCRECIKSARPDLATRAKYLQASQPALVSMTLILINVVAFIGVGLASDFGRMLSGASTSAHLDFALFNELQFRGGGSIKLGDTGEWYRIVTSGFLHYGLIHLGFNMYFLYVLGNQMEPQLGRVKFLALYVASLLGGAAGALLIGQNSLTAGASGAIYGLLGATAIGMYQHGINPLRTQIGTLLMINLALTFVIPRFSIGAHIGGLVVGAACGFVMLAPGYKGYPAWTKLAAPAAAGALALAVSFAVAS